MEKTALVQPEWLSLKSMSSALISYLKSKGYLVYREECSSPKESVLIFACKKGQRDIIEIKGYKELGSPSSRSRILWKAAGQEEEQPSSGKALLNCLLSLSDQYQDKELPVSFCLPDLPLYRQALERVRS